MPWNYVDGQALSDELRSGTLSEHRLVDYALQSADALEHALARGILHRNVKPGNILLNSQRTIRLVDFGWQRPLPQLAKPRAS